MSDPGPSSSSSDPLGRLAIGYASEETTKDILAGMKRKLEEEESAMTADEKEARDRKRMRQRQGIPEDEETFPEGALEDRKIFAGSLAPSMDEKSLTLYFSVFGKVLDVKLIRDKVTQISRGFAFVTFLRQAEARAALDERKHVIDGREIRVSVAGKQSDDRVNHYISNQGAVAAQQMIAEMEIKPQTRVYVGPIDANTTGQDLQKEFNQFGPINNVSRLGGGRQHRQQQLQSYYGLVDFKQTISMRRAFGAKVHVKGHNVKIALSRLAMEVVLSPSTVYFYEAHELIGEDNIEKYFSQYGQIYRLAQMTDDNNRNKTYGFVDYVERDSADMAVVQKNPLMPPGQYIKVSKHLPLKFLLDLLAVDDKRGEELIAVFDRLTPRDGTWQAGRRGGQQPNATEITSSKVRVPAKMVMKLIGERGKTVTEISRDSNTRIHIPKAEEGKDNVVITIAGKKKDITTAQYLMQKILKGGHAGPSSGGSGLYAGAASSSQGYNYGPGGGYGAHYGGGYGGGHGYDPNYWRR